MTLAVARIASIVKVRFYAPLPVPVQTWAMNRKQSFTEGESHATLIIAQTKLVLPSIRTALVRPSRTGTLKLHRTCRTSGGHRQVAPFARAHIQTSLGGLG